MTTLRVIADTRRNGRAGMVIGEHAFDNGERWQVAFECAAGDDAEKRLAGMIPEREATMAARNQRRAVQAIIDAARERLTQYVKALPSKTLTDAGFTAAQVAALKQ